MRDESKHGAIEGEHATFHLHLDRRFGDVLVSTEADEELTWFFNVALAQIEQPSNQATAWGGERPGTLAAFERRAEALHAARKIWERLRQMGHGDAHALRALYTERPWPRALLRRFGHLVAVVAWLPAVRDAHLGARRRGTTDLDNVTAWLEERLAAKSDDLAVWREQALRTCERAVAAYERARGSGPSVTPKEEE